jgi:dTDP-glucose 4,6-dehydratase
VRDWLFVEDHCAGIEAVLRKGRPGEIYNIGGGHEVENIEIANAIVELTGVSPELLQHVEDRPGHDRRYSLDYSKARDELGWEPRTDFAAGLEETVAWYRDNRAWWESIKSGEHYREYYERQYADRLAGK